MSNPSKQGDQGDKDRDFSTEFLTAQLDHKAPCLRNSLSVCHFTRPKNALCLKGFDARDFVAELREVSVTPHLAQKTSGRRSAINGRTTRHPGYAVS
ncbi:hypothetical protein M2210_001392 [Bradyrhizobium elkanii]|nr:hypothetical protein [Bradyrhizobium elkanii]